MEATLCALRSDWVMIQIDTRSWDLDVVKRMLGNWGMELLNLCEAILNFAVSSSYMWCALFEVVIYMHVPCPCASGCLHL